MKVSVIYIFNELENFREKLRNNYINSLNTFSFLIKIIFLLFIHLKIFLKKKY